jgi:hypothetical protein
MRHNVQLTVDDISYAYNVEGESYIGPDIISLENYDNLIKDSSFYDLGYKSVVFGESKLLREGLVLFLENKIGSIIGREIELDQYHAIVSNVEHDIIIKTLYGNSRGISCDFLPIDVNILEEKVSEICGVEVTSKMPGRDIKEFYTRIIRPNSVDHNPPHRDTWVDRLNDAVNIFFPLVGSDEDSSLSLCPGSHLWKESESIRTKEGAVISGSKFTVPSLIGGRGCHSLIRPLVRENEFLLFSPYLIHGGAKNFNSSTRASLEMRFWRDKNV